MNRQHRDRFAGEKRFQAVPPCVRELDSIDPGQNVDPERRNTDLEDQTGCREISFKNVSERRTELDECAPTTMCSTPWALKTDNSSLKSWKFWKFWKFWLTGLPLGPTKAQPGQRPDALQAGLDRSVEPACLRRLPLAAPEHSRCYRARPCRRHT